MIYDTIIVGAGTAGLISSTFLCKEGRSVLLCEKEDHVGGLVGSFDYNGFIFDAGIRAIENSGVLFPMLNNLGINIPFLNNSVSIGIEKEIVAVTSKDSLDEYRSMLVRLFPDEHNSINNIIKIIKKVMKYMDVIYGIENPLFMDLKNNRKYLFHTLFPWIFKYIITVGKIRQFDMPVEKYLTTLTNDPVLIDMICQHFFKETPSFFALSYFNLYLDYNYPKGGTGSFIEALKKFIESHGCEIKLKTKITKINVTSKQVITSNGIKYEYRNLIWCADNKALYDSLNIDGLNRKSINKIIKRKNFISDKIGCDSVLTLYLTADIDPSYFKKLHGAHFFYTPEKEGISKNRLRSIQDQNGDFIKDRSKLFNWINEYLRLTTYEISIPCLRDPELAPKGKTGLIISTLFDYSLMKHINDLGWYEESKKICALTIINTLDKSIYQGLKEKVLDSFMSTPVTISTIAGTSDGAITGWSFTNSKIPAVKKMTMISQSIKTPIPHVLQAGQWTYSPAGLPIAMITGKLASDHIIKKKKFS